MNRVGRRSLKLALRALRTANKHQPDLFGDVA